MIYDFIIIGTGISGLYSAYNIKQKNPHISFLILEQSNRIGGRIGNELFYDSNIAIGAGVARKNKDKLLLNLVKNFNIKMNENLVNPKYSKTIKNPSNINSIVQLLKDIYNEFPTKPNCTFKDFGELILGVQNYEKFSITTGYSDYNNSDIYDTLYNYGIDDVTCCYTSISFSWNELIEKLCDFININNIKLNTNINEIKFIQNKSYKFILKDQNNIKYKCNNIIVATTIDSICKLFPLKKIYKNIKGQPFLRIYGKFSDDCIDILKNYITGMTMVTGPLQKIIPINIDNGIYMIAYADNDNAIYLKSFIDNNSFNCNYFSRLIEKSLNIPIDQLNLIEIKSFYWDIGTHYYKPLIKYKTRQEFIQKAQNPYPEIKIVGEVVSLHQGWVEGALESVHNIL